MSFYISYKRIQKTALLCCLFTQSSILLAEEAPTSVAVKTPETVEARSEKQHNKFNFPRWPERHQVQKEVIPPPPPGPYMSLALNDFSASEPSFGNDMDSAKEVSEVAPVANETFSPDRPWPENLRPVKRWKPEDGYRYVTPQLSKKPYQAAQNIPPANYNFGYNRNPNMNRPDSRWMPSMNARSAGPYAYPPSAPDYRNTVNNYGAQSGQPPYRAPYPVQSNP